MRRFPPTGEGNVIRSRDDRVKRSAGPIPRWVVRALAIAFGAMALLSAFLVYASVRDVFAAWDGSGLPPLFQGQTSAGTPLAPGETAEPQQQVEITPVPWNGSDRVTILVMGLDYRDWEAGSGAPHSDTMMLVSVDPVAHTAGVLSIPRDLWVEIPDFEHSRINTAYSLGELYNYPGDATHPSGGPGLAMRTVENLIGVPVQFYAVVEFSAFERAIDEIGGINIQVDEPLRINPIGSPGIDLRPGRYTFNGAEALAYARSRRTEGGDFDRAQRQQQVLLAIRDTFLNVNGVVTLVPRAPALYRELSAGIRTNLSLEQMISLGLLAIQISPENIRRGIIAPPDMVIPQMLPDGAQVLKPVPDNIRALRDEIFALSSAASPSIDVSDPAAAAAQEAARVEVLNGAGIEGLATQAADYLRSQGIDVVNVANAESMTYAKTVIIDYTGNPYTARYLMALLNLTQSQIFTQIVADSPVDLAVIMGSNYFLP